MKKRVFSWILILSLISSITFAQSGRNRPVSKPASPSSSNSTASPTNNGSPPVTEGGKVKVERADPSEVTDDAPALKIDATLVTVPVVVSDPAGRYVPFLKVDDFKLFEDSVAQEISFFTSERNPFSMALVLDTSGSISGSMSDIQESAIRFVRELKEDDKMMVMQFNSKVEVLNDLSSDHDKIRHSIQITRAGGGTRLYDALYQAANRIKEVDGRKAIILLTDGEDTESRNAGERDALNAVLESGALMYVIQFPADGGAINGGPSIGMPPTFPGGHGGRPGQYPDTPFLHDIVKYTGGDMYYAGGRNGLPNVWRKIAEELRHIYVLGYYPTNALENGGRRKIKVQLKDNGVGGLRYRPSYSVDKTKQTAKS